jgi:hypothetical protein
MPSQARRALMTLVIERRGGQQKTVTAHHTNTGTPAE